MNSLQTIARVQPASNPFGYLRDTGVNLGVVLRFTQIKQARSAEPFYYPMTTQQDSSSNEQLAADESGQEMRACMALVAGKRDRAAFLQIYQHFAPRVKSFLLGRGLNPQTADDVLQEAMLAVWEKAGSYDPDKAAVSTWIFTIARYKYIDRLRHEGRQKTESDDADLRPSDDPVADADVLQQQQQDAVQVAIARLPEDQQSVIFLSFIKGLAHSEIAQQLGLPLGTVKSRIRRAFGQLREELGAVA